MRAVQITSLDGPSALEVVDVDEPSGDGMVLIEVHAAGVTFPGVLQSRGEYQIKPPLPFTPGSEVAGIVRSAPDGSGFSAGDRVAAFPGLGGFGEVVAAMPQAVFPLPESVSFEAGAGLPMNYLTMHFALVRRGALRSGETVLVHGAAGGIGTAAVQLAKALGARVIAVTSCDEKAEVARRAGADEVVSSEGFKDAVAELTGGAGVDIVVDPVGGDRFTDSLRSLAPLGRLLVIGFTAGDIPTVKVNRLLLKNIDVRGVGLGAYAATQKGFTRREWEVLRPYLESGAVDPPIGGTFPLEGAGEAVARLGARGVLGKFVIEP